MRVRANALQVIRDEHAALACVLRSILLMLDAGTGDAPLRFFDVMRGMLFYIDEFPERRHHPKESNLLFPRLVRARPDLMPIVSRLEDDHEHGQERVRELQHLLLAWELLGDERRKAFDTAAREYVRFYLEHMREEERTLLPAAQEVLSPQEWVELDAAFAQDRDPLVGGTHDPVYDRLLSRIVLTAPTPIGVGPSLKDLGGETSAPAR